MGCHTPEGRPCIPRNPLGYSTGCRRHRSTNGGSTPFLVTDSSEQMNNPQTTPIWDFPEHTRYPPPTERSPTKVASSFLFFLSVKLKFQGHAEHFCVGSAKWRDSQLDFSSSQ